VNRIPVYFSGLRFSVLAKRLSGNSVPEMTRFVEWDVKHLHNQSISILTKVKFKEFKDKLSFLRTFKDHRKIGEI